MQNKRLRLLKRMGIGLACFGLVIPLAMTGVGQTNTNIHADSMVDKEISQLNNSKQHQHDEAITQNTTVHNMLHDMKTMPSTADDLATDSSAPAYARKLARKQIAKDKADGVWYTNNGKPSKYFAHGIHGYQAGYYRGSGPYHDKYMVNGHVVSKRAIKAYYARCAKKYYARYHHSTRRNVRKHSKRAKHAGYTDVGGIYVSNKQLKNDKYEINQLNHDKYTNEVAKKGEQGDIRETIQDMKSDPGIADGILETTKQSGKGAEPAKLVKFAKHQEKIDKANGSWYSPNKEPNKKYAYGRHSKRGHRRSVKRTNKRHSHMNRKNYRRNNKRHARR